MRNILIILAIVLLAIGYSILRTGSKQLTPRPQDELSQIREKQERADLTAAPKPNMQPSEDFNPPREGAITAVMTVKGRGDVTMEFYPAAAPKTVAHVVDLIRKKFYDGILFHRVEKRFVVQAGDPQTRGMPPDSLAHMTPDEVQIAGLGYGGSGKTIPYEASTLQNIAGTVGLFLTAPRTATGDSQFYINLGTNHGLDGEYCVFGRVTQGLDVVRTIQKGDEIVRFAIK
jgi:cyclophilin family peptidyl-prolyl cis-trans isomerase